MTVPPVEGTVAGETERTIAPAAAAPIWTDTAFSPVAAALPENALMTAVPDSGPARSLTVTLPLLVRASDGSMSPRLVEKLTSVPLWTAVPPCSVTVAVMVASPFTGTINRSATMMMVDWVGARRGVESHAIVTDPSSASTTLTTREQNLWECARSAIMKLSNHLIGMDLERQQTVQNCERGYAMAALLIGLSLMSIMMSMALPVWSQAAKREREAELVFRGEQYARAIELYQRTFAGAFPSDFDTLVEQRFLRRLYKDPMTEDGEFQPILQAQANEAEEAPATAERPGEAVGRGTSAGPGQGGSSLQGAFGSINQDRNTQQAGATAGGLVGVVSKSSDSSLMNYNGREKYNEWAFIYMPSAAQPGAAGGQPGGVAPGLQPGGSQPFELSPGQGGPGGRPGGGASPGAGGPGSRAPGGSGPNVPSPTGGGPRPGGR